MTIVANLLFIVVQVIISKRFELKESVVQLTVAFIFGFFMDVTLFLVQLIPTPESLIMRCIFLIVSLFVMSVGLFGYFTAKFPLMPYDALTYVISEKFKTKFSKAKISSDLTNVCVAALVCIIFMQSLGSIGIGTIVAAYFIGKILGWIMLRYQQYLVKWIDKNKEDVKHEASEEGKVQKELTNLS